MEKNNSNSFKVEKQIDTNILKEQRREQFRLSLKRFFRNKLAVTGGIIVLVLIICVIFANLIIPYNPFFINLKETLEPVSKSHLFGTDDLGRDVFSRIIYGTRISFLVGLISTSISGFFGILIGGIAGYYGGWIDNILMRIMDSILSIPSILLAIVLVAVLGPSISNAMIAIGIVYIPIFARVVRSAVMSNKNTDYIEAAKAIGKSNLKIIFVELIPNCLSPIIVQTTVTFADAIILEAGLSFIGVGAPPPNPSWGRMLNEAMSYMGSDPLLAIFAGLAISISVLGFNLFGDGLRDILDPRLRRGGL